MAALHHATAAATITTSFHHHHRRHFTSEILYHRRPFLLISCVSTASKPPRRKNHLRQKILKTLKKPIIPKPPLETPITPVNSPSIEEIIEEYGAILEIEESDRSENPETGFEEVHITEELREVEVSAPTVSLDGNVGMLDKNSILKYGLWLVGAFIFHTVCAIWVFGSGGVDNEHEFLNGTEKSSLLEGGENGKGNSRVKVVLNGNGNGKMVVEDSIVYVDELEMERKIEEIRVMAREARETERLESKKNDVDSEDSETDGGRHSKSRIEEEVNNRLIKLRKKLKDLRDKMPMVSIGFLKDNKRKDGDETGESDEGKGNGALLFKKKYKFKSLSGDPVDKPTGFIASDDIKSGNREIGNELLKSLNGDNDVDLRDGEKQIEASDVDPKGSNAVHVVEKDKRKRMPKMSESTRNTSKEVAKERGTNKQGKGKGVVKTKGIALEKNNGTALEAVKFRKLNAEPVKSKKSSALDIAVSNEISNGNASLKGKGVTKSALKSQHDTEFWWLKLPYVLGILMRRGNDGELGEGLYTLKSSSTEDRTSHIVAFEDHGDATNFCYLLQSFFEDLEDFIADVVPLSIKELKEAVKSDTMRVIVVKRGRLRLYAGQPLADAEMALRAMIKND